MDFEKIKQIMPQKGERYIIIENGHTMFPEDVLTRLRRLDFLEKERINEDN